MVAKNEAYNLAAMLIAYLIGDRGDMEDEQIEALNLAWNRARGNELSEYEDLPAPVTAW